MDKSLLLNNKWDISLDSAGNFAWTSGKYAVAQNVACACRAFTEDMYFNQEDGIPHFYTDISNSRQVNPALLAYYMEREALKFPEVNSAKLGDLSFENRVMHGNLQLTLESGEIIYVTI